MSEGFTPAAEPAGGAPRLALFRQGVKPVELETPRSGDKAADGRGRVLACASCRKPITTTAARVEVAGAHAHSLSNPDGIRFRVGCFAFASGLALIGPRSTYFTWFPGYSWQVALCATCQEQLGWSYRSPDSGFHGLILDRLREMEEE